MGAGAGAAAAIDNEPSPRGSAIEKAQAELRSKVWSINHPLHFVHVNSMRWNWWQYLTVSHC